MMNLFRIFLLFLCISCSYAQNKPELILLDADILANNKNIIQKKENEILTDAFGELIRKADIALTKSPYSVTKKTKSLLPDGVSVHDYYSLSSYWWPNRSSSNRLPYVARDGKVNPERDKIPDRVETIYLCNDIYNLGLAYYFTDDEKYAKKASDQIKVFFLNEDTRMAPNFEYSQFVPGQPRSGGATISALAFLKLIDGVQLIESYQGWSDDNKNQLKNWFSEFLNWMLTSEKGIRQGKSKNNIGTYYTVQVTAYALFVGDKELAKRLFKNQAYDRIDEQIYAEGKMPHEMKRATPYTYTSYNTEAFLKLSILGEKLGEDLWNYKGRNGGSISSAYDQIRAFSKMNKPFMFGNQRVNPRSAKVALARYADHISNKKGLDIESEVDADQIKVDSDTYNIWLTAIKF